MGDEHGRGPRRAPSKGGRRPPARGRPSGGPTPPPRSRAAARGDRRPEKPELPADRPRLPRDVFQDVRSSTAPGEFDDVARALGVAEQALAAGRVDEAIGALEWAKAAAARSWAVREALGIAYYRAGRYRDAGRELLTYRRLTGRQDQNHLLADCARAAGDPAKARGYVDEMVAAGVEVERLVEGLLVVAGDRAERGDVDGALQILERHRVDPRAVGPHDLRLWYLQAELHTQKGNAGRAAELRDAIAGVDPGFLRSLDEGRDQAGPGED